jgi:hypothetical protein
MTNYVVKAGRGWGRGSSGARLGAVLGIVSALVAPACSSDKPASSKTSQACSLSSDCTEPYVCAIGRCRVACATSRDCGDGGSCITDGKNAVCQPAADKNRPCDKPSDCNSPLACATDYRCRNLCASDDDCNVLGISGRVCAVDKNDVQFCAEPDEVNDNGDLIASAAPGNSGKPVTAPDQPSEDGSGGTAGASTGGTSTAGSGVGGTGGVSSGGKGGNAGTAGTETTVGAEGGIGGAGEAGMSGAGGSVDECGGPNQACCDGTTCSGGIACDKSGATPTCACGTVGKKCCPSVGSAPGTCSDASVCLGVRCSCVAELEINDAIGNGASAYQALARRLDGTVWQSAGLAFSQVTDGVNPLLATDVAIVATPYQSTAHVGCAVVNAGVWCFPAPGDTLTDSTFLGAGLDPSDPTSVPVKVLGANGTTPLANIASITSGAFAWGNVANQGPSFCALANDGKVFCWGWGSDGQLGRGDKSGSNIARPVLASAGTTFSNVAEVTMGLKATCARKTDGSVWCWGSNSYAELGMGTNGADSYYPVQITFPGSGDRTKAVRLIDGPDASFCAVMADTTVSCWGYNGNGQINPSGTSYCGPTTILSSDGGPPLENIIDVAGTISEICMRTVDLDVLCLGQGQYPHSYKDNSGTAASGIQLPLSGGDYLGYVSGSGAAFAGGIPLTAQPPCSP